MEDTCLVFAKTGTESRVDSMQDNCRRGNEKLVGEHAADSSQPCRKGSVRGKITALEEAYGEIPGNNIYASSGFAPLYL